MELAVRPRAEYLGYDQEYRIREDTVTWLAEVLDGSMRVPTEFRFDGQELIAKDGSNVRRIFEKSVENSEREVAHNPKLSFELRRRRLELDEYHLMVAMASGMLPNTMVVVSDFPPELMHENNDIGGYNTTRKPTMLRVISANDKGDIQMYTQSLDGTDRQGLEDMYRSLGFEPQGGELLGQRMHIELPAEDQELLVDRLMGVYDRTMTRQYGGTWQAGRQQAGDWVNTYDFVGAQHDLVGAFVEAKLRNPLGAEELRYSLAAAMERRFMQHGEVNVVSGIAAAVRMRPDIWQEMSQAGQQARAEGKTFSGCGISSKSSAGGSSESGGGPDLGEAGYGDEDKKEDAKMPAKIRCVNKKCREWVPSKEVVKKDKGTMCCPKCKYEVDICTGKVLCEGKTK